MKNLKTLLFTCLIVFALACNNKVKTVEQAMTNSNADTLNLRKIDSLIENDTASNLTAKEEPEIVYTDSIDFGKYEVGPQKRMANAPIDWSSYPEAKNFKTRIADAYKDAEVDFAGFYVTSIFGCGASCIMGFMVDVRDGKIYDLPLGEENSCFFAEDRASYNWMSRLFIAAVCKQNMEDTKVFYNAYLWNEHKKEFDKIEEKDFLNK